MNAILEKIQKHKTAAIILIILIFGGGYYWHEYINAAPAATRYVLAKAEKGTLIVSISGSGQISAFNQIDIKPKVSGEITVIPVAQGQEVKSGALIAQLDTRDAQKVVRDAETNAETARLELDRLLYPTDDSTLVQAENSLIQAKDTLVKLKFTQEDNYQNAVNAKQKAEDALGKSYEDGFNTVSNAFLDLPTIISGLNDLLFGYNFNLNQQNIDYYKDTAGSYDISAGADSIGQKIKINKIEFTVIGVTKARGGTGFGSQDDMIFVPISTAQRFLAGDTYVSTISIQAADQASMAAVQEDVKNLLLSRHNIFDPTLTDFQVMNQQDIAATASTVTNTWLNGKFGRTKTRNYGIL